MAEGIVRRILVLFVTLTVGTSVSAFPNLEQFKKESPSWQALDLQEKALVSEIKSRDLVNAAELTATAATVKNERQILLPGSSVRYETQYLTAEVSKYFSTGTTLSAATGVDSFSYRTDTSATNNLSNFDLTLRQNLWRDSFGTSERIRRRLNEKELKTRLAEISLSKARLLIQFEDLYWTYANLFSEVKLRQESLKRWENLDQWIKNRFSRSAAEIVDVKQISATKTIREIQVQTLLQTMANQKAAIDALVTNGFADRLVISEAALTDLNTAVAQDLNPNSLEALVLGYRAELSGEQSRKITDDNRPDLQLVLQAGRTGMGSSMSRAWGDSVSDNGDFTSVGVVFSAPLDFDLKRASNESAELRFKADQLVKDNAHKNSQINWTTLQGQIKEVQSRIELLRKLTKEQDDRRAGELRRFQNGRANSLQMVTAEQDALEAQSTLKGAIAELNKLVARYYLFDLSNKDVK